MYVKECRTPGNAYGTHSTIRTEEIDPNEIPFVPGYNKDTQGPVLWSTWVTYLDISAQRGSSWRDRLPSGHDVLVCLQYGLGKAVRYLLVLFQNFETENQDNKLTLGTLSSTDG
jgi:redox-sensitive bicupin YhaK (pirin superfamily)